MASMDQKATGQQDPVLDDILEKFPFRRNNNQTQKLAKYLELAPGHGIREIADKTGMSPTTVRKIRKAYAELPAEEKAVFLTHMTSEIRGRKQIRR